MNNRFQKSLVNTPTCLLCSQIPKRTSVEELMSILTQAGEVILFYMMETPFEKN